MQPVSIVGYGAALVGRAPLRIDIVGAGVFASLAAATLVGTGQASFSGLGSTRRG